MDKIILDDKYICSGEHWTAFLVLLRLVLVGIKEEKRKKNWDNLIADKKGGEGKIVLRNWYRDPWGYFKEKEELITKQSG